MLDRWGQVICTSLKWSNHPHLEIVLDKRSYKWNPSDGWEQPANLWRLCCCSSAFSRCLACLHTWLFPTARWPKFDLSISQRFLLNGFSYCQHYIHSLGSESLFLSSALPEIEITTRKKLNQLSEGWVNFENRIKRLEATTCFPLHAWQILDGLELTLHRAKWKRITHGKGCGRKQRMQRCLSRAQRNLGSCVIAARKERVKRATGCSIDLMEKVWYSKIGS